MLNPAFLQLTDSNGTCRVAFPALDVPDTRMLDDTGLRPDQLAAAVRPRSLRLGLILRLVFRRVILALPREPLRYRSSRL